MKGQIKNAVAYPSFILLMFLNLSFNEDYKVAVASLPRQIQSGFQIGDRLLMLTKLGLGIASIDVHGCLVGLQTDGLIIVEDRLPVLT